MKFIELAIVILLFLLVRVLGQCDNSAGCFPPSGNIALFRNISTSSTCGENGTTSFTQFGDVGSGVRTCSADDSALAYPASNINDNDTTTAWQSDTGDINVTVQLDLEGPMLFESLTIIWSTPRPSAMIIERLSDFGNTWTPYRYFSTDCENLFMLNGTLITPDTILSSTEAVCTEMGSTIFPTMGSETTFDVSSHLFPEITEDEQLEFQTITNLRLQLLGTHADLGVETEQYYGIFEWSVYGSCLCNGHADECVPLPGEEEDDGKIYAGCNCQHRTDGPNCERCQPLYNNATYMRGTATNAGACQRCECYGHADSCVYNSTIGLGVCDCTNNTQGVMCDECVAGFYRDPAMLFSDPCIDCGCFLPGVSNPMICDSSTGVCICKSNVDTTANTICDTCIDRFWNISDNNPNGCQSCSCSSIGSTSQICDKTLGNCTCTDAYLPPLCSDCSDGFFITNDGSCTACGCNPAGAINGSCTPPDGSCFCRDNIVNIRCDAPANGFYIRPLDFFVFEAEDVTFSNDFTEVFPVVSQPTNFTGQGFLMFGSILTIPFSVPTTYQYELILRYSAVGDTAPVILGITSLDEVNITLECDDTSGITFRQGLFASLDETVAPNTGAEVVTRICLEADAMYSVTINLLSFTATRFLLDSMLLLPLFAEQSAYLTSPEGMSVYADILDNCLQREVGPPPSILCDPLIFILSVEFFGQVYPCDCNPIGTLTVDECSVDGGVCTCKPGVGGRLCDRCIPSFYNFSSDGCTACNCNPAGVVDITDCDSENGTCMCKANVDSEVNSVCDTCQDGFWDISSSNPNGCQECMCDPIGSSDSVCDKVLGNCSCNANFIGRTCSECTVGYYLSNNQCVACDCHSVGSSNDSVCNMTTGQCSCLPNISGRRCNETVPGLFYRTLDDIRFEAEDLTYPEGFSEILPITNNLVYNNNFTGRGYIAYPTIYPNTDAIEFLVSVPESSRYEVILRYRLLNADEGIVNLNVDSLMVTNNSLGCDPINGNTSEFRFVPISSSQTYETFFINACFDRGTQYLVTVEFGRFLLPGSEVILEVDSIVLIPRFQMTSSYYATQSSAQIEECIPRAAGSVPPTNTACTDTTFSLSVEFSRQVFECDCDPTGTISDPQLKPCECNGGYCPCKDGVGGEMCDRCLNGYFNFSTNGCTACNCDMDNSVSQLCDNNGQCSCAMSITGLQCNECEDGRFNFSSSGCQLCTCEPLGSASNICNKVTGVCQCIDDAIGDLCDACPPGSILTNSRYQRFCEPCRCYGQSDMCTADTAYSLAAISSDFVQICNNTNNFVIDTDGWMIEGNGTFTRCSEEGLGYNSSDVDMDRLVAPDNFTGDLTGSYSLQLSVQVRLPQNASLHSDAPTVEMCGPGGVECLIGEFQVDSSSMGLLLLTIPFREMFWRFQVNPNSQPSYLEFLYTLTDVTSLSFPTSFAMAETYYLQSISLQTVVSNDTMMSSSLVTIESMFPVEICQDCLANYTGRFCEQCASGFYRQPGGLQCVACDCNGFSSTCNPQTGICFGCTRNTTGDHCDQCVTGTFGDPTRNVPCQPCQCDVADPECILDVDGNQTCVTCPFGMVGRNCDECAANFTLTPSGERCFECNCFGYAMPAPGEPICDMENGQCNNCSSNTMGHQCQQCLDNYFGDPTGNTPCTECTCHVNGTVGICNRLTGSCNCKAGTTGANCDMCLPGYWGLHLGGCRLCDCCANGSVNGSCDQETGRCYCLPGVGSDTDDKCCDCSFGNYNFVSGIGCQDCGCSEASVTQQCNENGTCMCTEGAVGEKCDECGFEYSGTVPNCERCPVCFDEAAARIQELMANISSLSILVDQLNSSRAPIEDINTTISDLEYQLSQVERAVQYRLITSANVTYLEGEANITQNDLAMLQENFTMVMELVNRTASSVAANLEIISSFNGTVNGIGVEDVRSRLQRLSATILSLNSSTFASFQSLQQSLLAAEALQDDFDNARNNISDSQTRLDEVTQLLSIAENLSDTAVMQNLYNRGNLSQLNSTVSMLQNDLQMEFLRVNTSTTQLQATYSTARQLWATLMQTEDEIQNTSQAVQNLQNYSNTTFDLATNASTILQHLDDNVTRLMNRTEELLRNINTQHEVIVNTTHLVMMANVTAERTLTLMTPSIELAEMLAEKINGAFPSDQDIARISMTINNSTLIAQETLEIARNASEIAGNISLIVNRTIEQINTTQTLYDQVNTTYQQLLTQQAAIVSNASQVTANMATFNASLMQINSMLETIDVAISDVYTIGIENYNRSKELSVNASELCTAANTLEQRTAELNSSVTELSSDIDVIEQNATTQLSTVQTLYDNATTLNATAHSIPLQRLQDLLDDYLAERIRVTNLTAHADTLRNELDQLITDIQQSSDTLRECNRTP